MIRRIINLKDADREIECVATINKKKQRPLYWFVEPIGSDNADVKFVPRANRAGFGPNCAPQYKSFTDEQGESTMRVFRLSVCGLDKFKIFVGCKRDGSDKIEHESYEAWRRLYYSVSYMTGMKFSAFGPVEAKYREYGIDLEKLPGAERTHLHIIEKTDTWIKLVAKVTKPKVEARLLFVDRIWPSEWVEKFAIESPVGTMDLPKYIWPSSKDFPHLQSDSGGKYDDTFVRGTVTCSEPGLEFSSPIEPYVRRSGYTKTISWNFMGIPVVNALAKAGRSPILILDFSVKMFDCWGGCAYPDGRLLIARRGLPSQTALDPAAETQQTVIHEVGHGIGLVPEKIQEYNEFNGNPIPSALEPNPTWYGPTDHCSHGAAGTAPNFTQQGKCAMFHESNAVMDFCGSSCKPIAKRNNLGAEDADGMKWSDK